MSLDYLYESQVEAIAAVDAAKDAEQLIDRDKATAIARLKDVIRFAEMAAAKARWAIEAIEVAA